MVAAGADFGFDRNSSALALGDECLLSSGAVSHVRVIRLMEWKPGREPLVPSTVFKAVGYECLSAGAEAVMADTHYRASAVENLLPFRVALRAAPGSVHAWRPYAELRRMLVESAPDGGPLMRLAGVTGNVAPERLARQFAAIRATDARGDALRIVITTAADGSHSDVVSALALVAWQLRHVRRAVGTSSGRVER